MADTPFKMKGFSGFGNSPLKKGLWESLTGKKFKETKLGQSKIARDVRQAGKQIKEDIAYSKLGQSKLGTDIGSAVEQVKTDVKTLAGHVGKKKDNGPPQQTPPPPTGNGWTTRKGDPWQYKKTATGYQTRKGTGKVINVKRGSTAGKAIAKGFGK